MVSRLFLNVFILFGLVQFSHGCDGFKVKMIKLENCKNEKSVIELTKNARNASSYVNEKCEVFSESCVNSKTYKGALVIIKTDIFSHFT